ncbi:MAG: permease-like cell division protein FtsX [Candidatus Gastranaerophilales bacterium]|nr:permease-like cell division protein FtsX [Candidatus Gastranaerophilales bacterium]
MIFILPLNIATELRIIFRIIKETFKGMRRTGLMNIVIIGTMAAILSIFGCLFRTSLGIASFVQELGNTIEASVYLQSNASPQRVANDILKVGYVKSIKIIPKEKAWHDLKNQMDVPDIKNPLPDTIHVRVINQKYIDQVVTRIKIIRGVEGVQYAKQLARKIQSLNDITNIATIIVLIFLGGLTLFIISNTIHLVIQSRKREIEIMRLMGVSNWYIKAPYILQGAFYGLSGALISLIPLHILHGYLSKLFDFFHVPVPVTNTNIVILALLMMGLIVGSTGSIISVRKYLKV